MNNLNNILLVVSPLFFIAISITLLIKIKKGLEKQLTGFFIAFILLTVTEILRPLYFWSNSNIVFVNLWLSKFGYLAMVIIVLEFLASIILIKWVWGYVRFRAGVQIFLTTLGLTLLIFLVTTFSFTYLLLKNIEGNILESLETDAKVALLNIERLQFDAMASVKALAINNKIDLSDQNFSFVYITDDKGKVIDKDIKNVSLSDDPTFLSAIKGKSLSTITISNGAVSPNIEVKATSPIYDGKEKIIGTAQVGYYVDNALLDGIKDLTGMEITVFGGDTRSASTINLDNEKTRFIGIPEENSKITEKVLKDGQTWSGANSIVNKNYYSTYIPLKGYEGKIIGMVTVSKPQLILTKLSQNSIQNTFIVSALLLIFSIIPAYFIAKYIEENTTA